MSTLSLLAIMQDEGAYVGRWLASVRRFGETFDEVVVIDGGSSDRTIEILRGSGATVFARPFSGDFSNQRNFGVGQCSGEWIFELDADEEMSAPLLAGIRTIANDADRSNVDCVGIPRLNFIDGVLVASPGHKGLDFQYRLHRRGCRWRGCTHEEMTGYRARTELALLDGHFILHDKDAARHAARNALYERLGQ